MKKTVLFLVLLSSLTKQNANGQQWSNLGAGIDYYTDGLFTVSGVYSVASYNGSLYAGGFFYSSAGVPINNIAIWDGTNWLPLGQGIWGNSNYSISWVNSMAVYNGELYVGGSFEKAGLADAKNIAKWNGSTWSALAPIDCGQVRSLAVFNNELYVIAYFPTLAPYPEPVIAKWNGSAWSTVGTGLKFNQLYSMAAFNGALYVAGDSVNDGGGYVYHSGIVKWDGNNWTDVSMQLNGPVYAMAEYNGDLYAGGQFNYAGDTPVSQIARWNGSEWSALGAGIGMSDSWYTAVTSLAVYDGSLYAGGKFYYAGGMPANNIARWDGANWHNVSSGTNNMIYSLLNFNNSIIAGGIFDQAGNVPVNRIAKFVNTCTAAPAPAGTISGERIACTGKTHIYSITPVNGASNYLWTLPAGWTGSSTTFSIAVTAGPSGGNISVTPRNNCGSGISQTISVSTISSVPAQPGPISGNNLFCENTHQTFSISPVAGAANYTWDCPLGWSYGAQGNSTSTLISFNIGINSGAVSVTANNSCGNSPLQVLPVTVERIPPRPGLIQGEPVVCENSNQLFRVESVAGANSYSWTLPTGWTGSSNSTSIYTTPGKNPGRILVRSINHCGTSGAIGKDISIVEIPRKPDSIAGFRYVTAGKTHPYSTTSNNWATGYTWSVSGSGTIVSGQNSRQADIRWENPGVYTLSVKATNSCGMSIDENTKVYVSDPFADPFYLRISPNPSAGKFVLYAKQVQNRRINIKVMNPTGQEVLRSGQLTGSNDFSYPMYLHRLPAGTYVVKIWIDNEFYTRRIVKMNN
ncbi:MAG TPA: T9SS type A sorting domain-containing protein [Chitinophagaceae bacterium]